MAIKLLHIIVDDKFPKSTFNNYAMDSNLQNSCAIFNANGAELRFVGDISDLHVLCSKKEIKSFLTTHEYDFVFFHSLPIEYWPYIRYIPKEKKIIWWAWGYDIYGSPLGLKPFIKIPLYKPITAREISKNYLQSIKKFLLLFKKPYYQFIRNKTLRRIDYFQPVISLEYRLMMQNKGFRAKEYYHHSSFQHPHLPLIDRNKHGDILYCNSAYPTNNHMDVAVAMNKANLTSRTIHIPVSYGTTKYKEYLKRHLHIKSVNLNFLEDFIPQEEYFQMLSKCSYFISGVMRQQSMGNISFCMLNGIKVFLYKDSLPYIYLRDGGYIVYAIEDINENSFSTPLTMQDAETNRALMVQEGERREQIWNDFLMSNS